MTRLFQFFLIPLVFTLSVTLGMGQANAKVSKKHARKQAPVVAKAPQDGVAEARLIEIYRLIGKSDRHVALDKAHNLVKDFPTFALAQLVYGDLLSARSRPVQQFGDVPAESSKAADTTLQDLRLESQLRLKALRERPPPGTIPSAFLRLSNNNQHAIAIDASQARLYLFENRASGLTLLADYYISVGKLGLDKQLEGDQRTPLGVYFITSQLDPKALTDFYGSGALPINYPNVLDIRRGKTGSGIWLHGTPPGQFSRAPLASDGCVVLANPDLEKILRTVKIRSTPVVIAKQIKWVAVPALQAQTHHFEVQLKAWLKAKSSGNLTELGHFYAPDFKSNGQSLADWLPQLTREVSSARGRSLNIKDLSLLHWVDSGETMVVTFGEVIEGKRTGNSRRQYWSRQGQRWQIFYEGVNG
ncbi:MAG: L,D-transpeptidase family protein [Rhodoferax sp.]|uniref:L,D-transpeptidase family protein n=1 Tax=Rhodoferax sp. TaxID=50421 RepID=UPI0027334A19|nr:L,D-transpeptidase family protein [Rhodoferax sp.]MDP2678024.1 L,D-transpeptidase family protein [Rhodoferax sp.]